MKITYLYFQIFIHLLIAFIFLSKLLKPNLPVIIYNFLNENKDTLFGLYYIYLAYEVYNKFVVIE